MSSHVKCVYPGVEGRKDYVGTSYTARISVNDGPGSRKVKLLKSRSEAEAAYAYAVACKIVHPDRPGNHLPTITDAQVAPARKAEIESQVRRVLDAGGRAHAAHRQGRPTGAGPTATATANSKPAPGAAPASGSATGPDRGPTAEQLYSFVEERVSCFPSFYYTGSSPLEDEHRQHRLKVQEVINLTFQGRPNLPTPRQALKVLLFRYLKRFLCMLFDTEDPLAAEVCAEIGDDPAAQLYWLSYPTVIKDGVDVAPLREALRSRFPGPFAAYDARKAAQQAQWQQWYRDLVHLFSRQVPDWPFFQLSPSCTYEEAKRARNQLILQGQAHPDHGGSQRRMVEVNLKWEAIDRHFESRKRVG
jgi:hypothetical protein